MTDATWPPTNTVPTAEDFLFCDGTYGTEINRVSPEGNVYGQTRWVAAVIHRLWWNGTGYQYVNPAGQASEVSALPSGRPFGEIWQIPSIDPTSGSTVYTYYWYNSNTGAWNPLLWLWTIEGFDGLPNPGLALGAAHIVQELNVPFMWSGLEWNRFTHGMLADDEPQRHLPLGFLNTLSPDARVVYNSPVSIGIEPIPGGSGQVLVNLVYVNSSPSCAVSPSMAVLDWESATSSIQSTYIELNTSYWIYLANTDNAFQVPALTGDGTHSACAARDVRGCLFLSTTPATNGYLAGIAPGNNARLVGQVTTDNTPAASGGPYFLQEVDISLISTEVSLPETYREYSDFTLTYSDQNTLNLSRIDATYGQIYVGGQLIYLGEGLTVMTSNAWISWSNTAPKLTRNTTALSSGTQHWVYLSPVSDPFNFNAVNPATGRPWYPSDAGAQSNYNSALDMTNSLFLSTKQPVNGQLDGTWPGYYARLIGQVMTDGNGKFVNAFDLSLIRQPTLDPSYFDGLAEIEFQQVDATQFQICRQPGTSGMVFVRGQTVLTYDGGSASVHAVHITDAVQHYSEANPASPLTAGNAISTCESGTLYIYLANATYIWGALANKVFASDAAPMDGYLSQNWPGNNARWLCTVSLSSAGQFGQKFLQSATVPLTPVIDDSSDAYNTVLSSAMVLGLVASLESQIASVTNRVNNAGAYASQQDLGCNVLFETAGNSSVVLKAASGTSAPVILPDYSEVQVTSTGITASIQATAGTLMYAYLVPPGTLVLSSQAPDETFPDMKVLTAINGLFVGWFCAAQANYAQDTYNAESYWNEPRRQWTFSLNAEYKAEVSGFLNNRLGTSSVPVGVAGAQCWYTTYLLGQVASPEGEFGNGDFATTIAGGGAYFYATCSDITVYGSIINEFAISIGFSYSGYGDGYLVPNESPTAVTVTRTG